MKPLNFQWRKIGEVNIFEFRGKLAEPWLGSLEKEMSQVLNVHPARGLLMNLFRVEEEDAWGAQTLLQTLRLSAKPGVLLHNHSNCFVLSHMESDSFRVPFFKRIPEAVNYFGQEFALEEQGERRQFPRIRTALPAEFVLGDGEGDLRFEAVVTNISLSGLFTKFLDSETETRVRQFLDPFNLRLIKIKIPLAAYKFIHLEGKAVRREEEGMAVEFYKINGDKTDFTLFLSHYQENQKLGEKK